MGDLNYNYKIDETLRNNPIYLIEILFSMKQMIDKPTRVTQTTSSLIDILLSSNPDSHIKTGVFEYGLSDHYVIYTLFDTSHQLRKHKECRFRNYNKFNTVDFFI